MYNSCSDIRDYLCVSIDFGLDIKDSSISPRKLLFPHTTHVFGKDVIFLSFIALKLGYIIHKICREGNISSFWQRKWEFVIFIISISYL